MDPNACLEELIDLAKDVLKQYDKDKLPANSDDAGSLSEHVLDLDCWITSGGFLPERWDIREMSTFENPGESEYSDDQSVIGLLLHATYTIEQTMKKITAEALDSTGRVALKELVKIRKELYGLYQFVSENKYNVR